jgi:AraC-like DNA-binding protein
MHRPSIARAPLHACALGATKVPARGITGIALSTGFNDPAHFSRGFEARFGMSPSEYRASAALRDPLRGTLGDHQRR